MLIMLSLFISLFLALATLSLSMSFGQQCNSPMVVDVAFLQPFIRSPHGVGLWKYIQRG